MPGRGNKSSKIDKNKDDKDKEQRKGSSSSEKRRSTSNKRKIDEKEDLAMGSKQKRSAVRRRLEDALNFANEHDNDKETSSDIEKSTASTNNNALVMEEVDLPNRSSGKSTGKVSSKHVTPKDGKESRSAQTSTQKLKSTVVKPSTNVNKDNKDEDTREQSWLYTNFKMTVVNDNEEGEFEPDYHDVSDSEGSSKGDETEKIVEVPEEIASQQSLNTSEQTAAQQQRPALSMQFLRQKMKQKPEFENLMFEIFAESMGANLKDDGKTGLETSKRNSPKASTSKPREKGNNSSLKNKIVKSPSDTTVYCPALKLQRFEKSKLVSPRPDVTRDNNVNNLIPVEDCVNQYIQNLRVTDFPDDRPSTSSAHRRGRDDDGGSRNMSMAEQQDMARRRTNEIILEAERQKAAVAAPSGTNNLIEAPLTNSFVNPSILVGKVPCVDNNFNDDGKICQVSNHVDVTTQSKISVGGFVEMGKIYPRENNILEPEEENRIEFQSRDGKTFWIPRGNDRESKPVTINGVRMWEKAFRVYAAIYTEANPHRSSEIYQYVYTINLAASTYQWENVAYYDYHFRKLMAKFPQRSWSKVNTQLWSLSMRNPRPAGSDKNNNNFHAGFGAKVVSSSSTSGKSLREICCWRYNKNNCRKSAAQCKYEHRCSFCGGNNHIFLSCPKRQKKEVDLEEKEKRKNSSS